MRILLDQYIAMRLEDKSAVNARGLSRNMTYTDMINKFASELAEENAISAEELQSFLEKTSI